MSRKCLAENRKGKRCGAWALTGGMQCALHSDPERAARMSSRHGRKVIFSAAPNALALPYRPLKSRADVIEFFEETMNYIRQGRVDLCTGNTLGRLAGPLLKAIKEDTARARAEANASLKSQLCAKRLYLPHWRREKIEELERAELESLKTGLPSKTVNGVLV